MVIVALPVSDTVHETDSCLLCAPRPTAMAMMSAHAATTRASNVTRIDTPPLRKDAGSVTHELGRAKPVSVPGAPLPAHDSIHQVLEAGRRIGGTAGVHRRRLDDCAARRHEPAEPATRREQPDRPGLWAAAADGG